MEKVYELRYFRVAESGKERSELGSVRLRYVLDMEDPPALRDLLNRLLVAAALRAGLIRVQAHMVYLEVRPIDRYGVPVDSDVFGWSVPVCPDPVD